MNVKDKSDHPSSDLIFSIPKLIAFLSQGTTLRAGTLILTGTPAGIGTLVARITKNFLILWAGWMRDPKIRLKEGDEFRVEILPSIGTLINVVEHEK